MTSKSKTLNNPRGFTLMETLVAVLLLSVAIAGPLTIASKGLTATLMAKDQFIAFNLAQDAVEYVRFIRDTNTLGGGNWLTGVGAASGKSLSACTGVDGCYLDSLSNAPSVPTACSTGACPTMKYNTATQYFNYAAVAGSVVESPQQFIRTVKIQTSGAEAVVTVTVSWIDNAGARRPPIIVRETLYNWQ